MSTIMFCPICGGVMTADGTRVNGRRCTCTRGGAVATAGASTSGKIKVCCVCGSDVTSKKRMKDSATGRYWCYDCYIADQRKKGSGMTMRCPRCNKDYPPTKMVKHGEIYWCDGCNAEEDVSGKKKPRKTEAGGATATPGPDSKNKNIIAIAIFAACALAAVYFLFLM